MYLWFSKRYVKWKNPSSHQNMIVRLKKLKQKMQEPEENIIATKTEWVSCPPHVWQLSSQTLNCDSQKLKHWIVFSLHLRSLLLYWIATCFEGASAIDYGTVRHHCIPKHFLEIYCAANLYREFLNLLHLKYNSRNNSNILMFFCIFYCQLQAYLSFERGVLNLVECSKCEFLLFCFFSTNFPCIFSVTGILETSYFDWWKSVSSPAIHRNRSRQ